MKGVNGRKRTVSKIGSQLSTLIGEKSHLAKVNDSENFDQRLLEAIDEGLSGLGEAGKASIYIHLEETFNIRKQEIPNKLDSFSNALHRIFGIGARNLEILIMKRLHQEIESQIKLEASSELASNLTFTQYIELMKRSYNNAEKNKKIPSQSPKKLPQQT